MGRHRSSPSQWPRDQHVDMKAHLCRSVQKADPALPWSQRRVPWPLIVLKGARPRVSCAFSSPFWGDSWFIHSSSNGSPTCPDQIRPFPVIDPRRTTKDHEFNYWIPMIFKQPLKKHVPTNQPLKIRAEKMPAGVFSSLSFFEGHDLRSEDGWGCCVQNHCIGHLM